MPNYTFNEIIGAVMGLVALVVVAYASIMQGNEGAMTALVGVLGAAAGFFLRGRTQPPQV